MSFQSFYLVFLSLILICSQGKAAHGQTDVDRPTLAANARKSIVYLEVKHVDPNNRANVCGKIQGSGFIISPTGYVLTAAHNLLRPDECVDFTELNIDAKIGYKQTAQSISAELIELETRRDIALIMLAEREQPYIQIPICNIGGNPRTGEKYIAYGFPFGTDFASLDAIYNNPGGDSGRWVMSSDFTNGMSGGPVTDLKGRGIGLIQGGLTNTPAVRYVVPMRYASDGVQLAGLTLKSCDQISPSPLPSPPIETANNLLKQQMPYSRAREVLINNGWQANIPVSMGGWPERDGSITSRIFYTTGYQEIDNCSGTGLGLCRFKFFNATGDILVVVTANNESLWKPQAMTGAPTVSRWFVEQ